MNYVIGTEAKKEKKMKRVHLILTGLLILISGYGQDLVECEVDGISYRIASRAFSNEQFQVIKGEPFAIVLHTNCSGNIPSRIIYEGKEYPVTSMSSGAFANCKEIENIVIPDGIVEIPVRTFQGCTSLTSVTLPNSISKIGDRVFQGCTSLATVTLPNSISEIGQNAFENCSSLHTIVLPNSLKRIVVNTFKNCSSLTTVTIPSSVTGIAENAFDGCNNLSSKTLTQIKKLKAPKTEVMIISPSSVSCIHGQSVSQYGNYKTPDVQWKWKTSFNAKKNVNVILRSSTYMITTAEGKVYRPGATINSNSIITIKNGKSNSITESFVGKTFAGGVFKRNWFGIDEYGYEISIEETVNLSW